MDSFENYQYESASTYGGMGIVDDTSSVYTANTTSQSQVPDIESLSITDDRSVTASPTGNGSSHSKPSSRNGLEDDFDGVLDDLKDEGQVALPPHACRYVLEPQYAFRVLMVSHRTATVASTPPRRS